MNRRSKTALPVILAMIILIVALVYALFIRPNYHRVTGGNIDFQTLYVGRTDRATNEKVKVMDGSIYSSTDEGLTKYGTAGDSQWNKSYHFNDPLFLVEAPYMAVVDLAGKEGHIFNEEGLTATVLTDYVIVGAHLNSDGYLTLIMENDEVNYINMYNGEGRLIVSRRTSFMDDGYPIEVVTSSDAMRMVTSHLGVSQHRIESTVTFLDFSGSGEAFEDRIIGHEQMADTMVSELKVMDGYRSVVVGNNQLVFYDLDRTPELLKAIQVAAVIEHICYTHEEVIVSYGDAILPDGEELSNSVVVYDSEGNEIKRLALEEKVTGLSGGDNNYYIIQSSHLICGNGSQIIWETDLYKPLEEIYHINNDRYLLVFDYDYEVVEIRDI